MAEGRRNEQTADDQPRSLESPDFYTRQLSQTVVISPGTNQLDDSGIDLESSLLNQSTDVGRGDSGGRRLDGVSQAQTLATDYLQDLTDYYSQLDSLSRLTSRAKDKTKRSLRDGSVNRDLVDALQMRIEIFSKAAALKRFGEELMNKLQSCSPGLIVEETRTYDTAETGRQTELVTALTSFKSQETQNEPRAPAAISTHDLRNATAPAQANPGETVRVYDVNQHIPDTLRAWSNRISDDDDEAMYEGATAAAPPTPTVKEDTLESQIQRILALHREHKRIDIKLVDLLLPLSKSVGAVMKEYHPPGLASNSHNWGTCLRLGSKYVMTNKHVVDMAKLADPSNASVVLNYYHEPPLVPTQYPIERIRFNCCDQNLDYSILELTIPSHQFQAVQKNLPGLGHLVRPLGNGQKVTLIGHQEGEAFMSMDPSCPVLSPLNWYEFMDQSDLPLLHHPARALYRSTFGRGSSGSPVFDHNGFLVGLHTRGFPIDGPSQIEQMIRMTAIRAELRLHEPELCDDLFFSP